MTDTDNVSPSPAPADVTPEPPAPPTPRLNPALVIFAIFPVAGLIIALFTIASGGSVQAAQPTPPAIEFTPARFVGMTAPDFTLKTPEGKTVTLSSLRGQVVFLNFWATWCVPCKEEMPAFQTLLDGKIPGHATVLAVDADPMESAQDIQTFQAGLGVHVPSALDPDGVATSAYQVIAKPHTFIIDQQGVIRYDQLGTMTEDMLRQYMAVLDPGMF